MPLLTNDDWRRRLAGCLDAANREAGFSLVAYVFMPEHVHLLVSPADPAASLGRYLARVKQPFSKEIRDILAEQRSGLLEQLTVRERPGKSCFRFWQEGPGFDRNLFTPEAIQASIQYIHDNPVKRKLCLRAIDWRWSSARFHIEDPSVPPEAGPPRIHGRPDGALA
jgi:putative transposase